MFRDLSGKTALITGASSGLGLHFAKILASDGVRLVLAARRIETLEEHCADIVRNGGAARAVALDVTSAASVSAALESFSDPIDILINNAGIATSGPALEFDLADWDDVLATNLRGAFLLSQAAGRRMKANGGGVIVNVASILGLRVANHVSAYAVSKAGLIQLTQSLALEWARHNIRVNALCPGYIETDLNRAFFATPAGQALINRIPSRRLGQMADLDAPLLLLCSEAGRYMTGATLAVDGGHLVSSL